MKNPAIYMTGNGRMAAAFCQGDLLQVFGPPYSSPSLFTSAFLSPSEIQRSTPVHPSQSGIWTVELSQDGQPFASVTDFALPNEACLVRRIQSTKPLCMRLSPTPSDGSAFHYETVLQDDPEIQILLKTKNGNPLYNDYSTI